ncbi:[protein-PII] uridylyltransferase [Thiolinea disciformis]|uniref:[protein-PII] uridylyltransferase n=1 Tax=Thiolinea disciformis TaxID=125614 RepID=UPI00035DA0D6|nr:[protein-PII] uridylyltransferase [Thiolinea disciformis]
MNPDLRLNPLLDLYQEFKAASAHKPMDYARFLRAARKQLEQDFQNGEPVRNLIHHHAGLIDQVLVDIWLNTGFKPHEAALIAVGGYGREELHPASDIDLLILLPNNAQVDQDKISRFLTFLWDMSLEVGHSVRSLSECLEAARADLTIITNLIEARLLYGNRDLYRQMRFGISPANMWDSATFFLAKLGEQTARYQKFGETAYRVEPNLKEGRGGLRDIHMISWIIEREYGQLSLIELHEHHLLEPGEYECLRAGRDFLWSIRFILHNLTGRKEDRLLFDYQHSLAKSFGYLQPNRNDAVEAFMQRYYQTITELERLTDVLLGVLRRQLIPDPVLQPIRVGEWYQKHGTLLAVNSTDTFTLYPTALLEIFMVLQNTPELTGLAPETIRLIRGNLHRMDYGFRQQAWHRQIFMQILRSSSRITFVLRLMNRYGVLAAYLPAFGNIVGRMQYDLFHAYTVDEHTLYVISNVRRYSTAKGASELPFCSEIFKTLAKPELLYLAALFHDIAKGRNGDHSELGAVDAFNFSREHGLNLHDASLVSWLVQNHLVMSVTAQRKDISDLTVIQEFANQVVAQNRLDYLFLLTIADIKGTNPKLWNSWKQSLLSELYFSTRSLLRKNVPISEKTFSLLEEKRSTALDRLIREGFDAKKCFDFWEQLGDEYLLQHSVESICWHAEHILTTSAENLPLVRIRQTTSGSSTIIFVYSPQKPDLFTRVVSTLEQLSINIVQARIVSLQNKTHDLYTLHILGSQNKLITDPDDQEYIVQAMQRNLRAPHPQVPQHRQPRILRNFNVSTRVHFRQLPEKHLSLMEVKAGDMPGLLSRIGETLDKLGVRVRSAQITTLGEQAEDIFYVTTRNDELLVDPVLQEQVREAIIEALKI